MAALAWGYLLELLFLVDDLDAMLVLGIGRLVADGSEVAVHVVAVVGEVGAVSNVVGAACAGWRRPDVEAKGREKKK